MFRAFFNIRLDDAYLPELTGQPVQDAEEARSVARTIVRRLVQQHGGEPRLLNAVMAVTAEDGATLFELSFFEALYVPVAVPQPAGTDLRRAPLRRAGRAALALDRIAARVRAVRVPPRLDALLARARGLLDTAADLVTFRRDPRQRFGLAFETGR